MKTFVVVSLTWMLSVPGFAAGPATEERVRRFDPARNLATDFQLSFANKKSMRAFQTFVTEEFRL